MLLIAYYSLVVFKTFMKHSHGAAQFIPCFCSAQMDLWMSLYIVQSDEKTAFFKFTEKRTVQNRSYQYTSWIYTEKCVKRKSERMTFFFSAFGQSSRVVYRFHCHVRFLNLLWLITARTAEMRSVYSVRLVKFVFLDVFKTFIKPL